MAKAGSLAYAILTKNVFFLETSKRQENDLAFAETLKKIREGKGDEAAWRHLQRRNLLFLSPEEKLLFQQHDTVHAFAKKADAMQFNLDYLRSFANVISSKQIRKGIHVQSDSSKFIGAALAIPEMLILAIGCVVRLLKNLFTHLGLYNGALGTVKAIIYDNDHHPAHQDPEKRLPAWIVVEFLDYKGPAFFQDEDKLKWVPLGHSTLRCDKYCCSRSGFPLAVQKAKTIHSFQGLTAGEGQMIRRVVWHVDTAMEAKAPNLSYTGLSRVQKDLDLAISGSIDLQFVKKLGNFKTNQRQRAEISRLRKISEKTKASIGDIASVSEYVNLLRWFIQKARPNTHHDLAGETNVILDNIENSIQVLLLRT